jgi:mycothiol synthase
MAMSTVLGGRVDVSGAPDVPGLVFRHVRGPEDYPGMVEANMAARDAYGVEDTLTVEAMASDYANLTNCDVGRDVLVVELDGRIAGYTRVQWDDQHDDSRTYWSICLLRPDVGGRGIGSGMLAWDEQRIREIAAEHPRDDRERWIQAFTWDANERAVRLLRRNGYSPVRRGYEMVRPDLEGIPEAPMPDGLEVLPVGRDQLREVWEANVESFRGEWGEGDDSEEAWRRFRDNPSIDPSLFVVAFDNNAPAGMVLNVIHPADTARKGHVRGLLASVAVRRPWRRRGLARALIVRSLRLLRERGATSAYLSVDAENPNQAMTLYEGCGFRIASSETTWRKPLTASEVTP